MFVAKLNEISTQTKFAVAVCSTNANMQDCEMFESPKCFKSTTPFEDMEDEELFEDASAAFFSASHAEDPSGVIPELLAKI